MYLYDVQISCRSSVSYVVFLMELLTLGLKSFLIGQTVLI